MAHSIYQFVQVCDWWGHSGSPASVGPQETPEKNAPPQKVPISRFYLLSLLKTRSDSPGAAPPQNFPILKIYWISIYFKIWMDEI